LPRTLARFPTLLRSARRQKSMGGCSADGEHHARLQTHELV
jgi:hypothetical protein